MNDRLDRFIQKSELVSNVNHICTSEELTGILADVETGFQFIDTDEGGLTKSRCEIGKDGFPAAIVDADYAIAETGSVVIHSSDEQKRLATCLAEDLHVVLPLSCIKENLIDIADYMREKTSVDAAFIAFVTGASRTADIERVLTIGVHGPARMFVYIIKDK